MSKKKKNEERKEKGRKEQKEVKRKAESKGRRAKRLRGRERRREKDRIERQKCDWGPGQSISKIPTVDIVVNKFTTLCPESLSLVYLLSEPREPGNTKGTVPAAHYSFRDQ